MKSAANLKLVVIDDEGRRNVIPLEMGETSIGRNAQNTVRLKQRNVSRVHARLLTSANGVTVEDLKSDNGVWVNGARIQDRHVMASGDVLAIGDFRLELEGLGMAQREPAPSRKSANSVPVDDLHEATSIVRMSDLQPPVESQPVNEQPARLVAINTSLRGNEYPITINEATVGRTAENDIQLDHRSVSRTHIKITRGADGKCRLTDLGSANGTLINGERYKEVELRQGDLITLGHLELRFVAAGKNDETDEFTAVPGVISKRIWIIGGAAALLVVGIVALWAVSRSSVDEATSEVAVPVVVPNDADTLQKQRDAVALELQAQALQRVDHALAASDWKLAEELLATVKSDGPFADKLPGFVDRINNTKIDAMLASAKQSLERREYDDVIQTVDHLVRMNVDRPVMWELREAVEKGRKADRAVVAPAPARAPVGAVREPPVRSEKKSVTVREPPVRSEKPVGAVREPPVPAAAPAPTKPAATETGSARDAYTAGYNAFKTGQVDEAIDYFNRCIQQDSAFGLCYRAMGVAYSRQNNMPKAARYYRLYLKVDPDAKDAEQVRRILQSYEKTP